MTKLRRIGDYNFVAGVIQKTESEEFAPINDYIAYYQRLRDWLLDHDNVALTDGDNCIMFEKVLGDITFEVHFMFMRKSRGKYAIEMTLQAFDYMMEKHGAISFIGSVPSDHYSAKLFCRIIGCKSLGMLERATGTFELFQWIKPEEKGEEKCLQQ